MLTILALAFALVLAVHQADSGVVNPPPGTSPVAWFIGYVFTDLIPLLTAWFVKKYNVGLTWYSTLDNAVKRVVYIGGTMVLMYIVQFASLGLPKGTDITHLAPDFIGKLVYALVVTLAVKAGIDTGRAKPTPDADASRARRV
jgi:hypothetical protein